MKVNRTQLGDVLGVSLVTVDNYIREGMPSEERPEKGKKGGWVFVTKDCIAWLIQRAEKKLQGEEEGAEGWGDARTRDRSAMASLRELELKKKLGQLVDVADVVEMVERDYTVIKQSLRAIPARMSQLLIDETDAATIESLLKTEVTMVLENLSDPETFGRI